MAGKNVVVLGGTGMVGGLALSYALGHPDVASVTSVGRRPTGVQHDKLREIQHRDFSDFVSIQADLQNQDLALFCLGSYTMAVSDEELRRTTVDYTTAFGNALREASPGAAFCLLSGQGADSKEKSRTAFARYKGMAENALLAMGFLRTHLFRPGYIYPVTPRSEPTFSYRVMRALYPTVRRLYPNIGLSSEALAKAMLWAGLNGTPKHSSAILENRDIRRLGKVSEDLVGG